MKVVSLVPSAFLGGSELCAIETIKSLSQFKHCENYLIVPDRGPLEKLAIPFCKETKVIEHSWWISNPKWDAFLRLKMIRGFYRSSKAVKKYLQAIQPDLVITHTIAIPSGALAAKWSGIPHLWYIHEYGLEDQNMVFNYGFMWSTWLMSKLSNRVVVNSKNVLDKFAPFFENKISPVYYAVETQNVPVDASKKEFDIICVGRITEGKNQKELLEALAVLKKEGLILKVLFLGRMDEMYHDTLRKVIDFHQLNDQVVFKDFVDQPLAYLSSSRISVVCSKKEAFGRVIIESMKLGIPVIVPDTGSGPELVEHMKTGLIYHFGEPNDLSKMIQLLFGNASLSQSISRNAAEWAGATFSLEKHANTFFAEMEGARN